MKYSTQWCKDVTQALAGVIATLPPSSIENAHGMAARAMFETITPKTTIVIVDLIEEGRREPITWCPDESWAREFLEGAHSFENMRVWEVERGEAGARDITDAFCWRWADDLTDHTVEDFDDYIAPLPEFVKFNASDWLHETWAAITSPKQ